MALAPQASFWEGLREGRFAQIYLLYGAEELLVERALQALLQGLVTPECRDFNLTVFKGSSTDAATFLNTAFTPPMFATHRVILLRGARAMPWAEELADAIRDLPPTTYLLLTAGDEHRGTEGSADTDAGPGDKGKKKGSAQGWKSLLRATEEKGQVVEFKSIPRWEMESWVVEEGRRAGIRLTREAAVELLSRTGNDLRLIESEVEKLAVFAGSPDARIQPGDVAAVVGRASLDSIFDLVDAIAARKAGRALKSLQQLVEAGEAPQYLLFMMVRQFRMLLTVKALGAEGSPPSRLFKPLGTGSEFMVRKCVDQSRSFSIGDLEEGLAAALRTDLRLKSTGAASPEVELQSLIATLCR